MPTENPTGETHLIPISGIASGRREFIQQVAEKIKISKTGDSELLKFLHSIKNSYRGRESENTQLLKYLKDNPEFRKIWEHELNELIRSRKEGMRRIHKGTHQEIEDTQRDIEKGLRILPSIGRVFQAIVSFFSDEEDKIWKNSSAAGGKLHYGDGSLEHPRSCATNWGVYPIGTKFMIDGIYYQVDDYGSALTKYPNRLDLYHPGTKSETDRKGIPEKDVTLIQMGDFNKAKSILTERIETLKLIKGNKLPKKYSYLTSMLELIQNRENSY